MSKTVGALNFAGTIADMLKEYGNGVISALQESIDETAEESAGELKSAGEFNGRKYRRGWAWKVTNSSVINHQATAYNKTSYQLTHLLEFGHAKQNGGRTRAFEHIAPVNDKAQEDVIKKLERKLQRV